MTQDQKDFVAAARHAGFRIRQSGSGWSMWRIDGDRLIDNEDNLFDLGETIKAILKAERGQ